MKNKLGVKSSTLIMGALLGLVSCKAPEFIERDVNRVVPAEFKSAGASSTSTTLSSLDSSQVELMNWREYFKDSSLVMLIDTALIHNQELNITLQQIRVFNNEIRARSGEYLPFVTIGAGGGVEKSPRYTRNGAVENGLNIQPGTEFPEPFPDMGVGLYADWEIDIWNRLHNAKDAAVQEYLGSVEGKNFMVTNLIAEIANSYYELIALDNQLVILEQNIEIQSNALNIVKVQKESARVTELAVKKFEAELNHTLSLKYEVLQDITETENKINFLLGRFPQHIERNSTHFYAWRPDTLFTQIPTEMLQNRPDIKRAEHEMNAANLDVKVARANYYPRLNLSAGVGFQAYKPNLVFQSPASMLYSIAGDLTAPLFNKRAITAAYYNANARQVQSIYEYEKTVLNAFVEVTNQLNMMSNMSKSFQLRTREVEALNASISISGDLFRSARADYMEVLMTQRDAVRARFELVETKKRQLNAMVNIYRALGGGWN